MSTEWIDARHEVAEWVVDPVHPDTLLLVDPPSGAVLVTVYDDDDAPDVVFSPDGAFVLEHY